MSLKQIGCLIIAVALVAPLADAKSKKSFDANFLKNGLARPVIAMKVIGKRDGINIWMLTFNDQSVIALSNDELQRRQNEFIAKQKPELDTSKMKPVGYSAAHSPSAVQVAMLPPVRAKKVPQLYGIQSARTCEQLSEKHLAEIEAEYGTSLTDFITKAVIPLHQLPRLSRVEVLSKVSRYYNIDGWASYAGVNSLPQGESSRQFRDLLASKIFGFYMDTATSYSKDEARGLRHINIDEGLRTQISQRISQVIVEPRVKFVQESTCTSQYRGMGLCQSGQSVLFVTAQMSPHIACYCDLVKSSAEICIDSRREDKFRVTYVVTPKPNGSYQIIDVMLLGSSLVQTMTADVFSVGPAELLKRSTPL